ncbi:MAG: right-handed parallel beta-helix repeat-containing protein, partial [Candidatus Brocadiia bacterium]
MRSTVLKLAVALVVALVSGGGVARAAPPRPLPLDGGAAAADGVWFEREGVALNAEAAASNKVAAEWRTDPSTGWLLEGSDRETAGTLEAPEGCTATHLEFLHTFEGGPSLHEWRLAVALAHRKLVLPPEPPTVCVYEVAYADGETLKVAVRFGEGINQWYRVHEVGPMLWAKPAWQHDLHPHSGQKAVLYAMKWPNPRPKVAIESISLKPQSDPAADYGSVLTLGVRALDEQPAGRYYYVATFPDGSDENPGTFERPFASLERAAEVAGAGDTVFVRGGLYSVERRVEIQGSGEPDRWLTFTAYPGETPVLDGMASRLDRNAQTHGHGYDHDSGLISAFGDCSYVRIAGLHVRRSRRAAIGLFGPGRGVRATGHEVLFCTTYRTWAMGINIKQSDHVRVIGNRIVRPHDHTMFYGYAQNRPLAAGAPPQEAIDLSRNTHFEVAFNEVYGGGKEAIDCISVTNGRIHHNYVHHCLNGIYIDAWGIPIERLEIDHNYIHDAFNGIPLSTEGSNDLLDFSIHHNIVIDSKPQTGVGAVAGEEFAVGAAFDYA